MRKYRLVAKKGEGTFSEVLKAQNIKDGKYHAIKCMKNRFDSIDQVNNLREIQALRRLSPHDHIITLEEVLYDQPTGRLALVFELMDANLYELIRGRRHYLNATLIKSYMYQLLKSLDHMHRKGIFHRDIKPENILIESTGELGKGLKLADFGSCRGIYSKQPYTEYISTRWYRAPECLLTDGYYGPEMDLWGAGCVFFEITSLYPLFPGTNEIDQVSRIHKVLGTPDQEILSKFKVHGAAHVNFDFPYQKGIGITQLVPHASPDCVDLMMKLLRYDASERITGREALRHVYFKEMREIDMRRQSAQRAQPIQGQSIQQPEPKAVKSEMEANLSAAGELKSRIPVAAPPPEPAIAGLKALPNISAIKKDHHGKNASVQPSMMKFVPNEHPSTKLPSHSKPPLVHETHHRGDNKSGLPPIVGAVLGNSKRNPKVPQASTTGLTSNSNAGDHRYFKSFQDVKKVAKRKSRVRVIEAKGPYRYQQDKMHYSGRYQYKDVKQPSSFNSFLQSKSLGHEIHNQNENLQKYKKKHVGELLNI